MLELKKKKKKLKLLSVLFVYNEHKKKLMSVGPVG